jgi:metallo-beta-lactamase class B
MAALQALTGAKLMASAAAAPAMSSGQPSRDDPQFGELPAAEPANVGAILPPDGHITLGNLSLQAIATPGHTAGATTWQWQSCAGSDCRTIVYADSLSAISSDDYRFSAHPDYVRAFRDSLARLERLDCTMLITPHPSASDMYARAAAGFAPDPTACARYSQAKSAQLNARLAQEQTR